MASTQLAQHLLTTPVTQHIMDVVTSEYYYCLLLLVVFASCFYAICLNGDYFSCLFEKVGFFFFFLTWPKPLILRYVPVFEKKSEIPISLGSRERALRAERFKLKSEFGPFLTYVTWSKMSHVLPMFETFPWFSSDLGLKPQVIPMVPKALHVLSTTCRSDPILHHAPPISFCCTNTGP